MAEDLQLKVQEDFNYFKTPAKNIFLISPVRISTPEIEQEVRKVIQARQQEGYSVYYPLEDTYQKNDPTGLRIIRDNRDGIIGADWVEIFYKPGSKGSIFDLGMSFMAGKKLESANPEELSLLDNQDLEDVQVKKFILRYINPLKDSSAFYDYAQELKQTLPTKSVFEIEWKGKNPKNLLELGMVYASQYFYNTQIALANPEQVQRTEGKSFENVLLEFHADYLRSKGK